MSGHVGDLSTHQAEALEKFKAAVADIPNKPEDSDHYYLRWLRARKFKVDKAVHMLKRHMVYRKDMHVETILQDWSKPEVIQRCFPLGYFGEDRSARPIVYFNLGNVDLKGYYKALPSDKVLLKFVSYMLEEIVQLIKEYSEKNGAHIESITLIVDVEFLSFQKHYYWPGIQVFREALTILEANYPEILHDVFVLKAPKVFPFFYNLIKHFMDKRTRDKIHILTSNWKEELRKYISPDHLPQVYGGTRCEPDEWCTNFINPGCDVPPELYLTNQMEIERQKMDRVVVGRGGSCELEYEVELEGSLIRWEFISTGYDISYGLLQKESTAREKPKLKPVVPIKKVNSHIVPEAGTYTCGTPGKYVFKFDNSYSWVHSKEVFYSIQVLPPNTEPDLPDLTAEGPSNVTMTTGDSSDDEEFYDCENN